MASGSDKPSLRELIEMLMKETNLRYTERFDAQERAVAAALASAKEAVAKAESATEKRLEGLNELRGVVNDILNKTMPRIEAESAQKSIQEKLETAVKSTQDKIDAISTNWDARHQDALDRIVGLEKSDVGAASVKSGAKDQVDNSRSAILTVITIVSAIIALIELFLLLKK